LHYYPYDKIIISAACPNIPEALVNQLKVGGIIIAPVGERLHQRLIKATKTKKGLEIQGYDDVVFVPLQGKQGFTN
jgi:protein-L-isoaspartate(D-aspartate) O-methyltransferase